MVDLNAPKTDCLLKIFLRTSAGRYATSGHILPPWRPKDSGSCIYILLPTLLWDVYPVFFLLEGWAIFRTGVGVFFPLASFRAFFLFCFYFQDEAYHTWPQDLKDFVRPAGEVTYADVDRRGSGYPSFIIGKLDHP